MINNLLLDSPSSKIAELGWEQFIDVIDLNDNVRLGSG